MPTLLFHDGSGEHGPRRLLVRHGTDRRAAYDSAPYAYAWGSPAEPCAASTDPCSSPRWADYNRFSTRCADPFATTEFLSEHPKSACVAGSARPSTKITHPATVSSKASHVHGLRARNLPT